MSKVVELLRSRKFWVMVVTAAYLLVVQHDYQHAAQVVMVWLGAQGIGDAAKLAK